MKNIEQKNDAYPIKPQLQEDKSFFGAEAVQTAQPVMPIEDVQSANSVPASAPHQPTVSLGKRKNTFSALALAVIALFAVFGSAAFFASIEDRSASAAVDDAATGWQTQTISAQTASAPESDFQVNEGFAKKTAKTSTAAPVFISAATAAAPPVKTAKRSDRKIYTVAAEDEPPAVETERDSIEDASVSGKDKKRTKLSKQDKKLDKQWRKLERGVKNFQQLKQIIENFDDN